MDDFVVLLIEDDEATSEMYRLRLALDGYSVLIAADGEEGLAMAGRERPDLIYLDLHLPRLNGFQVLERLRSEPETAAIPVVILTNYVEPELRLRGLELGALDFLIKFDITPADLSQGVERRMESSEPSFGG